MRIWTHWLYLLIRSVLCAVLIQIVKRSISSVIRVELSPFHLSSLMWCAMTLSLPLARCWVAICRVNAFLLLVHVFSHVCVCLQWGGKVNAAGGVKSRWWRAGLLPRWRRGRGKEKDAWIKKHTGRWKSWLGVFDWHHLSFWEMSSAGCLPVNHL